MYHCCKLYERFSSEYPLIPMLPFFALTDQKCYSVEEAVESIGFGRFHVLLFIIMGSANVRALLICLSMIQCCIRMCQKFFSSVWVYYVDCGGDGDHVAGRGVS